VSQPHPIGPIIQLLDGTRIAGSRYFHWHTIEVSPRRRGRDAGVWCNRNIEGDWSFTVAFNSLTFYIKDPKEAFRFKLMWGGSGADS
jgi:hypothetical protein